MKPDNSPGATEPAQETTTPAPVEKPAETSVAEPPKNLEFTEVPSEFSGSPPAAFVEQPVQEEKLVEVHKPTEETKDLPVPPTPPIQSKTTAHTTAAAKKAKPAGSKGPGGIITFAVIVFVALAVIAFMAYSKSK